MKVFIYFNLLKVSEAGRQRVLREKRKNVHAGIVGIWCGAYGSGFLENSVTYNPYKYNTFVDRQTEKPVYVAHVVSAIGRQVTYQ